jgi:hypothetical protein
MLRFPVARHTSAPPPFWPRSAPDEDRLADAELRIEALLRDAARCVDPGTVDIDEVVADFGPGDIPLLDISLAIRALEGDDPCVALCRLLSQLLARLNLHLEGVSR